MGYLWAKYTQTHMIKTPLVHRTGGVNSNIVLNMFRNLMLIRFH